MSQNEPPSSIASRDEFQIPELPLPRSQLRQMLFANGIGPGTRVIVAGYDNEDLIRFLNYLGIDVCLGQRDDGAEPKASTVAMIIARHLPEYDDDLFAASAFQETAELMSRVLPGGALVVVFETDNARSGHEYHSASCFVRHFAHFVGQDELTRNVFGKSVWQTRIPLFRQPSMHFSETVALRVPSTPRSPLDWQRIAWKAGGATSEACCEWARGLVQKQASHARAA